VAGDKYQQAWERCLDIIKVNVDKQQFQNWFAPLSYVSFQPKEKTLLLHVPTNYLVEYIEEHYKRLLYTVIWKAYGRETKLMYRVEADSTNNITIDIESTGRPATMRKPAKSAPEPSDLDPQLNSEYTFDTFIEGASNKLARSVGQSIAKNPKQTTFNPLFIYGHSGVGKTHLVNAIGLMMKELHPEKRVLYVTANLFQLQYTDSIRQNTFNDFVHFYQTIDVLILDDVQEFAANGKTQNTFFHIFNHLKQNGKQIIMTCDRAPGDLKGMEERMLTRFKWGLQCELEQPNEDLCRRILINKVHHDGLQIPEDVINFIAAHVNESVRDLEGIINSLMAYSVVYNRDIDMAMAEPIIRRAVKIEKKPVTIDEIIDRCCDYFGITQEELYSPSRKANIVTVRQTAMYLASELTKLTASKIGIYVGKRNHATVIHSVNQCKDRMASDKQYKAKVKELTDILKKHQK